ncbi:hypothetical protein KO02_08470 [Sphingobacterium sp. ML3W]|uniref:hypothetical protein n=1 Tax=Sphingobacterium sp. ML3W TaxID=1538644 RepID=UPI0004F5998E|nr:hypothetical protein [Sphingobacterium sp. ML3W]AIM36732.1 hypothetical protein KO02_08470 [Sphingobacterium sp. ML3W]
MKNNFLLIPIIIALLLGCSKDSNDQDPQEETIDYETIYQEPENPFYGIPDTMSVVMVSASIIKYNEWQNFFVWPEHSYIIIWPSDNRDLDIGDVEKAIKGIAIDQNTKTEVKTGFTYKGSAISFQDLTPGKYFIAVILNDNVDKGKKAYSTKEISVKQYGKIYMNKIFSNKIKDGEFEEWTNKIIEK